MGLCVVVVDHRDPARHGDSLGRVGLLGKQIPRANDAFHILNTASRAVGANLVFALLPMGGRTQGSPLLEFISLAFEMVVHVRPLPARPSEE